MKNTALITGASNGIGLELALVHASKGGSLVLVARSKEKLENLKVLIQNQYKTEVYLIVKDLSTHNAAQEVYDELKQQKIRIDYLLNNAGFGDFGLFHETDWKKTEQMIQLNITALTQFTRLFLNEMLQNKQGKILNVASTAAFQPGPTMAVYFATKAYVLHFSEAIANELENTGITVTALCPGATESGFKDAADMHESNLFKNKKLPSSNEVAVFGYEQMMKGKVVAIHGFMNYVMANSVRFTPRALVVKIARMIQGK